MRVGIGYDVHRLASGRRLVLGGLEIPHPQGLVGWSDADVLTHAIIDALLGAAGLGDIGCYFPSGDPEYKDVPSINLLRKIGDKLKENNWRIVNIDATIVAERPKLRDYFDSICEKLSQALQIKANQVNVKANTSEQLGFVGREEGMVAWATALIESCDKQVSQ
ncbi:MAG: 2-C-methyl-D-erythritol 2,4-cyclodiphosphate synthase [Dehalococcoidales bacterium]|nr:2-C-methyl-D-erythritol 2,4-cyclodiphosphate synthase [Dehalococcoidales bacterium]